MPGATIADIILLLYKDVLRLVIISGILVIPFSYSVITRWMETFAYKAEISYLLYLMAITMSLIIVLLVTLFQSIKTARTNPVKSLKYE